MVMDGKSVRMLVVDDDASLRAGAYDYLLKPFEDIELISTVANRAVEKIRFWRRIVS
jgi:FixJ family two-component response regulator